MLTPINFPAFDGHAIRVFGTADNPWFVAKDVCQAIGIDDHCKAVSPVDTSEKGLNSIPTPGGTQQMTVISEAGMYQVVLRCREATTPGTPANRFFRWVTREVLPQIRKEGEYRNIRKGPLVSGEVFGELRVLRRLPGKQGRNTMYEVRCSCGNTTEVAGKSLRFGNMTDCGQCGQVVDEKKWLTGMYVELASGESDVNDILDRLHRRLQVV